MSNNKNPSKPSNSELLYARIRELERTNATHKKHIERCDAITKSLSDDLRGSMTIIHDLRRVRDNHAIASEKTMARLQQESTLNNRPECPICMSVIHGAAYGFVCGHCFCKGCIDTWTTKQGHSTCPMCRGSMENKIPIIILAYCNSISHEGEGSFFCPKLFVTTAVNWDSRVN